jgi:hypothetical protein
MNIEAEWLLAIIAFPVVGFFFKMILTNFEKHDHRMDQMEKELVSREEWKRELDRSNKIIGELYNNKVDKEFVNQLMKAK